ncbi:MAG: tetratricopeptide repeat protein [Gemmatimonadetes bacterium]|nr:tetratricopeptide repeat protein [Gemmatimonadota bacterium]
MSEMLANQYFLSGSYERALPLLERFLLNSPDRAYLKNKLLICYLQTDQVDRALEFCLEILRTAPLDLVGSDPCTQRFPCLEQTLQRPGGIPTTPLELNRLAVINLFCKPETSLRHLRRSLDLKPGQAPIREILSLLEPHV